MSSLLLLLSTASAADRVFVYDHELTVLADAPSFVLTDALLWETQGLWSDGPVSPKEHLRLTRLGFAESAPSVWEFHGGAGEGRLLLLGMGYREDPTLIGGSPRWAPKAFCYDALGYLGDGGPVFLITDRTPWIREGRLLAPPPWLVPEGFHAWPQGTGGELEYTGSDDDGRRALDQAGFGRCDLG